MHRRTLLALASALALLVAPTAAADPEARTGTRINLLAGGLQFFPAGEPFHIAHGWVRNRTDPSDRVPTPRANGRYGFSLAVDGQEQPESFVARNDSDEFDFNQTWVHNFPNGRTGTQTFTGHWFGPCTSLVENGFASGPCEHPTEPTTAVGLLTITVVFVP